MNEDSRNVIDADETTRLVSLATGRHDDFYNRNNKKYLAQWYSWAIALAVVGPFSVYHLMRLNSHQIDIGVNGNNIDSSGSNIASPSTIELLGKSKGAGCGDERHTLKLAVETPFTALFEDLKGQKKFEASSVILDGHTAYAVCDSSWAISKFSDTLEPFGVNNVQIGDPFREDEDSGYEALLLEGGIFYTVRESIAMEKEEYHAIVEELSVVEDDYNVLAVCPTEFQFEGDSKGFEGAIAIRDNQGTMVLLGLCEGNHCSEKRKKDKGHGVIVAMTKSILDDGSCQWSTVRKIKIPKSADFEDYSAITMDHSTGKVAISSQEESQVWFGQLLGLTSDGLWDLDTIEFDKHVGEVYSFPKNNRCETVYCNIEGIQFIDDSTILAVSDKMKSKQNYACHSKDQSAHLFVIPN